MKSKYQIIYLNGPSSAGKTPLARALQNYLSEPFLVSGHLNKQQKQLLLQSPYTVATGTF